LRCDGGDQDDDAFGLWWGLGVLGLRGLREECGDGELGTADWVSDVYLEGFVG
jgi:hypothetical protein